MTSPGCSGGSAIAIPIEELIPRHDVPSGGRSGFVVVDGRQVHYLEWGRSDAAVVVCLHGGAQTAYMWEELGSALADRYHVLAPDLPGHGDSDPFPEWAAKEVFDRWALSEALRPFLDEFGVRRAVFVGGSLGGIVSLTQAAHDPGRVGAIVLVDIGHRLEEEGVRRILEFMKAHESFASLEEAAEAVAEYLPHRREVRLESLRRNLRERPDGRWEWKHMIGRRLRQREAEGATSLQRDWRQLLAGLAEEASKLTCPVLVLRGRESDLLSEEGAQEIADLIPDSRLADIGGAGHHVAGDNPETTVDLVSGFLTEIGW